MLFRFAYFDLRIIDEPPTAPTRACRRQIPRHVPQPARLELLFYFPSHSHEPDFANSDALYWRVAESIHFQRGCYYYLPASHIRPPAELRARAKRWPPATISASRPYTFSHARALPVAPLPRLATMLAIVPAALPISFTVTITRGSEMSSPAYAPAAADFRGGADSFTHFISSMMMMMYFDIAYDEGDMPARELFARFISRCEATRAFAQAAYFHYH